MYELTGKLLHGDTCVIFGEGTWNLHPYKPMQNIRIGGVKAAAIAGVPIVPVILEYVEVPGLCSREKDLYSYVNHTWLKKFGTPLFAFDTQRERGFLFVKRGEVLEYCCPAD